MPKPLSKLKVLIADPVPHMSELVAAMLRALKTRDVRQVTDAAAAMAELRLGKYDVLILDDSLKNPGSVNFTLRLRASEDCANRDIPIIMMSSLPDAASIARARDAGVNEFLRKPFSTQHLEARLNTILSVPRDFIAVDVYTGPDRRRRKNDYSGKERRTERKPAPANEP